MRIVNLQLQNFRCFEKSEFDFGSRFNLLIGDNATGKTAILESLVLSLAPYTDMINSDFGQRSIQDEHVRQKLYLKGHTLTRELQHPCIFRSTAIVDESPEPITWSRTRPEVISDNLNLISIAIRTKKAVESGTNILLPLIVSYGAQRVSSKTENLQAEARGPISRLNGYENCLGSAINQRNLLDWFKTQEIIALQQRTSLPALNACRQAISQCVLDCTNVYFDMSIDELVLEIRGSNTPFSMLSDGFRNMLAIVADMAVRCAKLNPHLEADAPLKTNGVVMIDELDLHLHPKWQRRIVEDLMRAFPQIQFIATSHSPFIIQSLPSIDGVKLLNLDNAQNQDFREQSIEDIAETIQGVELPQKSQRHIDMMRKAEQYFALLNDDESSDSDRSALRRELEEMDQFSENPAFQAVIRMQELVSKNGNGTHHHFKGDGN